MRPSDNINDLIKKLHLKASAELDKRVHDDISAALTKSEQTKSVQPEPNIWRIIMRSRIPKLAAAAMIIVAVLIGLNIIPDGGSGVAWGEVLNNVQKIKSCIHRMKMTVTAGPEQTQDVEFTFYRSTGYGTRRDSYYKDKLISKLYIPAEGNTGVELVPDDKKYVEAVFTDEQIKQITEKNDPREIVKEFMCCNNYTKLGSKTIDGIEVEGIEVDNEQFGAALFERGKGRLWVAVDTDLPVLIELEGVSAGGAVQINMTLEEFDWNAGLQASDFEPNIPPDYTMMAQVDLSDSVEAVTKGLRGFANITGGQYPTNLDLMTTSQEIREAFIALRKKQGKSLDEQPTKEEMENILSIQGACMFYGNLVKENKDVAYYGDKVTAQDTDKVLMRWKISDNEYRIIFGDLSTLDVSAEKLADLEKSLPQ